MSSCQRCSGTSSNPRAFLLTCRGCSKTWHHRCHMPPVEDEELIQRLHATNEEDKDNDLSAWMCRRCKKRGSGAPSAMPSREPTTTTDTCDSQTLTSGYNRTGVTDTASKARVASTADVRVKQESSTTVDARLVDNRERNMTIGKQESAPAKRTLTAKRTRPSAANQPHVPPQPGPTQPKDADVRMAGNSHQVKAARKFAGTVPATSSEDVQMADDSHRIKAARKFASTVSATSTEDDVMEVDSPTFPEPTSRALKVPNQAITGRPKSVAGAHDVHSASSTNEREREVRPVDGVAIQLRVNQDAANEVDEDPDDLYGPPVERRIIRILPSLAEELREQQRRVAAEKEKRRAPLAPDWISARHANDPLWKEIPTEGRKRRKPVARKLGDNGLNVNELMDCFTVQNWVREHKA